jgi:hypothetical protein
VLVAQGGGREDGPCYSLPGSERRPAVGGEGLRLPWMLLINEGCRKVLSSLSCHKDNSIYIFIIAMH